MARGDDLINLIFALADMVESVAKNMKKTLAIISKKSKVSSNFLIGGEFTPIRANLSSGT